MSKGRSVVRPAQNPKQPAKAGFYSKIRPLKGTSTHYLSIPSLVTNDLRYAFKPGDVVELVPDMENGSLTLLLFDPVKEKDED
jgi:hypothetical protein